MAGGLVGASDTLWLSLFALFLTCHMTFGDVLNRLMVTRVGQVAYPRFHWALLLLAGFAAMPRLVQEFGLAPADASDSTASDSTATTSCRSCGKA